MNGEEKTQKEGIRCFLVGGGQSLAGFNFSRLNPEITIGINIIFKFFEPNILIWSDVNIYPNYKAEIDRLKSVKYGPDSVMNPSYKDVLPYKRTDQFYGKQGLEKGLFGGVGSYFTGIVAVSLAISLGYSPIYLLGYDGGNIDGKTWFHDVYKVGDNVRQPRADRMLEANKNYDVFKDYEIYNCSLKSNITQFPKVTIEEILDKELKELKQIYEKQWTIEEYKPTSPGLDQSPAVINWAKEKGIKTILDAGCGMGYATKKFIEAGFDAEGLDIASNCLQVENIKFHNVPIWDTRLNRIYDLVFCCDVMEHVPEGKVEDTLKELRRIGKYVFLKVACFEDNIWRKYFKQPLHITIKSFDWWKEKISRHFKILDWAENYTKGKESLSCYGE